VSESYEEVPAGLSGRFWAPVAIAIILALAVVWGAYMRLNVLQRFYFPQYLRANVSSLIPGQHPKSYRIFWVQCGTSTCAATDSDLVRDFDVRTWRYRSLRLRTEQLLPDTFARHIGGFIYRGSLFRIIAAYLYAALGILFVGLLTGRLLDKRWRRQAKGGIQVRGRRLVTPGTLNRKLKGDGFELWTEV
jgi:hypothetical protein